MKIRSLVLGLITLTLSTPAFARFLAADFEDLPPGPISSQPGWGDSSATLPIIYSALVTNAGALHGHQCAELPAISTSLVLVAGSRIVNTNFVAQPAAGEGSVLRASVWIYRDNPNDRISITLGQTGRTLLYLYESVAGGTLIYSNTASGGWLDTGRHLATGRYSQVVFHYDTSSSDCSLDYDGVTQVDDTMGGAPLTNFNRFSIFRSTYTGTPGRVFVDEMRLDAFPDYVAAWWRFDEFDPAYADDAVGNFFTSRLGFTWPRRAEPADDFVWAAGRDVADRWSQRAFSHTNLDVWKTVNLGTNWTVEALVRLAPQASTVDLINLGRPVGTADTTGSFIRITLVDVSTGMTVHASLRDDAENTLNDDNVSELAFLPRDDQWHHVALVKTAALLQAYADYQPANTVNMAFRSDGGYRFRIFQAVATMGSSFFEGNGANTNHCVDELRVSSAALSPTQFLHRSTPHVVQIAPSILAPDAWSLSFETAPGSSNSVQLASQLAPGDWKQTSWLTSTGHQMIAAVPAAGPTNLMRVTRRLQP